MRNTVMLSALIGLLGGLTMSAQILPKGFVVAEESLSPDGRYGVIIPMREQVSEGSAPRNSLVELKAGRVVAEIQAETAWDTENHQTIEPAQWLDNASVLLWNVDGKWFPDALNLLKLEDGKLLWQVNVLAAAQKAILAQTKKIAPKEYEKARKATAGNGSAYPEGFSIDVTPKDPVGLPMKFAVALTSNPKGIENFPTLESHLELSVAEDGTVTVSGFGLGPGESTHF